MSCCELKEIKFFKLSFSEPFELEHYSDPVSVLFNNYKEIENLTKENCAKLLYFNRISINKILIKEEKYIFFESIVQIKNFVFCFYFYLLVIDNPNIVNYIYNINYLRVFFGFIESNLLSIIKKIFYSKIFILLVYNYKGTDEYKIEEEDELNEMQNICKENISNNKRELIKLGLDINDIREKKIDEIYIQIINDLIRSGKFEDFKYTCELLNNLEFESINITITMYNELTRVLNREYIMKFKIKKKDDLLKIKNMDFYYILFKYILKNPIYIYQNPALYEIRKNILLIIKSGFRILSLNNIDIKDRTKIEFIIEKFTDSRYYIDLINKREIDEFQSNPFSSISYRGSISSIRIENNISSNAFGNRSSNNNLRREQNEIMHTKFLKIEIVLKNKIIYNYYEIKYENNETKCKKLKNNGLFENEEENQNSIFKEFIQKLENGINRIKEFKLEKKDDLELTIFFKFKKELNNNIKFNYLFFPMKCQKFQNINDLELLHEINNNESLDNLLQKIEVAVENLIFDYDLIFNKEENIQFYEEYQNSLDKNN